MEQERENMRHQVDSALDRSIQSLYSLYKFFVRFLLKIVLSDTSSNWSLFCIYSYRRTNFLPTRQNHFYARIVLHVVVCE
jgi:hypothetical protein